jgi:hypothetical protein
VAWNVQSLILVAHARNDGKDRGVGAPLNSMLQYDSETQYQTSLFERSKRRLIEASIILIKARSKQTSARIQRHSRPNIRVEIQSQEFPPFCITYLNNTPSLRGKADILINHQHGTRSSPQYTP